MRPDRIGIDCKVKYDVVVPPGWLKQTGPLRQVKLRGLEKVDWLFVFSCAAHNLLRLPRLMAQPPGRRTEQCV